MWRDIGFIIFGLAIIAWARMINQDVKRLQRALIKHNIDPFEEG